MEYNLVTIMELADMVGNSLYFIILLSKYSNGIFVQNGASAPFKIYVTCRYNWSNYLEGNSWLIKRINFLWR